MRHKLKHKKLNRTSSHRSAMLANMAVSLIFNEQIKTTLPKAKTLRPYLEKLVTKAKTKNLANRRLLIAKIKDQIAAGKLLDVIAPRYEKRPGGYLRIIKAGYRTGDVAPMAYIEFIDRNPEEKGARTPKPVAKITDEPAAEIAEEK